MTWNALLAARPPPPSVSPTSPSGIDFINDKLRWSAASRRLFLLSDNEPLCIVSLLSSAQLFSFESAAGFSSDDQGVFRQEEDCSIRDSAIGELSFAALATKESMSEINVWKFLERLFLRDSHLSNEESVCYSVGSQCSTFPKAVYFDLLQITNWLHVRAIGIYMWPNILIIAMLPRM